MGWDFFSGSDSQSPRFSLHITAHQDVVHDGNFPGGPVVKSSPSNAGGVDLVPGLAAKSPHAWWSKKTKHETSNIVTNSIKTLKIGHIKKKKFKTNVVQDSPTQKPLGNSLKCVLPGTSLVAQWLRLPCPLPGACIQPLVGVLRSCILHGEFKNK